MVENIELWSAIVGLAISVIAFAVSFVRAVKKDKEKKTIIETKTKLVELAKVVQKIPGHIIEAEQATGSGNGELKKRLVLNAIQLDCFNAGVEYSEAEMSAEVETILSTPQKKLYEENSN